MKLCFCTVDQSCLCLDTTLALRHTYQEIRISKIGQRIP